jgi:hypothetical protein
VDVPPGDIRRSPALAGGALYDLGCYCVSAARLFGGHPTRVWAEPVLDGAAGPNGGVDLRLAATVGLPDQVLALFDVGLDLTRRDELELVGTGGRLIVPDPWLCRAGAVVLETGGRTERLPADPEGAWGLTGEEADAYRIEFDVVSAAMAAGDPTSFGRADVVDQAAVLEAIGRSAATGFPVEPPHRQPGRVRRRGTAPNPWPVRRTQARGGYSVRAKRATARPSRTRQVAATIATWSGTGTCQPPQVMPGSKVARAAGVSSRWSNTTDRIGSTA